MYSFSVDINKTENGYDVYIGSENSSGCKYHVDSFREVSQVLRDYVNLYINTKNKEE